MHFTNVTFQLHNYIVWLEKGPPNEKKLGITATMYMCIHYTCTCMYTSTIGEFISTLLGIYAFTCITFLNGDMQCNLAVLCVGKFTITINFCLLH